ncbi:MAG: adenylosuccinate synthetase, partial [Thermoplasmata archaeon]|nr:adenylosuccinate synthetase [Thermoplasmata archaeon]
MAEHARYVVRSGGGPNAGHSIHLAEGKAVLHQLSCGVLRKGVTGVSGPGMVINPFLLEDELRDLAERHLLKGEPMVSERAHVLLPIHEVEDAWEDAVRAGVSPESALGTTKRGIGPAYADRYARWGIRFSELVRPAVLSERLEMLYKTKTHLSGLPDRQELTKRLSEAGSRLAPMIRATEPILWSAIENGENILLEGAQSALLDVDFGTYPYVTSSHPTSVGALLGSGIPPQELDEVVGVAKGYCTRVGAGPFPTKVTGEIGEYLQREGGERGATTGRIRDCGWLDLVLLRYVTRLNGFTSL